MTARELASPKQYRLDIATTEGLESLFEHLRKDKPEPANPDSNQWTFKPFRGIIRGDYNQSSLEHDKEVIIKNGMQYADYLNISKREYINLIYKDFPNGNPTSSKTLANAKVAEYNKTLCHQYLAKHKGYVNPITGEWSHQGAMVDSMGRWLYNKFGLQDPALLRLEKFQEAKKDARFYTETGKTKFSPLSHLRCVMEFAALQVKDSPLKKDGFAFSDGDEWDTTGLKNVGGKKDDYLQADDQLAQPEQPQTELERFVNSINEPDTLVLHRFCVEGGARISSALLLGTRLPDGYLCQPIWKENALTCFEPKVEKSKTGGKVKRYFVPETTAFFQRYLADHKKEISEHGGAWFKRWSSEEHNWESFNSSIKAAGKRAGLWDYKQAQKGQSLAQGEHLASDGRVYRLQASANSAKGTTDYHKRFVIEGKLTTSHTVGKHTFASLGGVHGLSLDDVSDQCGTDPTTIKDYYHGTLGDKRKAAILGEHTFKTWIEWIRDFVEPLYTNRYNQLIAQNQDIAQIIQQEETAMADVENEEDDNEEE